MTYARILLAGLAIIAGGYVAFTDPVWASEVFSSGVLILIVMGFFFRPKGEAFLLALPPVEPGFAQIIIDGQQVGENYPQMLIYRLDVSRLWILAIPTLGTIAYVIYVEVRTESGFRPDADNPYHLYFFGYYAVVAVSLALAWVYERRLISRGLIALGFVYRAGVNWETRYEFFDHNSERRGGMAPRTRGRIVKDNVCPIIYDKTNPDQSKPAFAFLFCKFRLVERRHLHIPNETPPREVTVDEG